MEMRSLLVVAAVALSGCAGYAPSQLKPGDTEAQAVAELGQPTGRYPLPQGSRLEFARGPYGKHTYMVDLDAQGRVTGWQQVLTEQHFNQVVAGWTRDRLLMEFGRPAERRSGDWQGGQVWSYRYPTEMGLCQWFQVSIGDDGVVQSTGYGIDPHCDAGARMPSR
jgi:hypothetical protein